ncbi:hypothetical protein NKI72_30205 [Mesorhizobium sp. M0437]|uniref:hypothetical protein n=1 Tax=Mesorhizobium sp. M0437 TaxID=2956945 RepID=UPI00333B9E2F
MIEANEAASPGRRTDFINDPAVVAKREQAPGETGRGRVRLSRTDDKNKRHLGTPQKGGKQPLWSQQMEGTTGRHRRYAKGLRIWSDQKSYLDATVAYEETKM